MLINHRFAVFLAGSFLASFGGWINYLTILDLATWRFNATPFGLVLVSAALTMPSVVLTKIVARVCARYASSMVIVLALAVTLITTAALFWVGHFVILLAIVALKSAALSFVDPAEMRYVTDSLEDARQPSAFRLLTVAQNVAKIAAPAIGALFGSWAGAERTVLLSIALLTVAIVLILLSATWRNLSSDSEPALARRDRRTQVRGRLVPLLCCAVALFAMFGAISNQFPLMLKLRGFDESVLGLLVSFSALGGILGSALPLREAHERIGMGALVIPALASAGAFIAIGGIFRLPLYPAHFLLDAAFFTTGILSARFRIGCQIYIAQCLAKDVAGATATLQSSTMLALFIAPFGGALVTSYLSASNVFFVLGTFAALVLCATALVFRDKPGRVAVHVVEHAPD